MTSSGEAGGAGRMFLRFALLSLGAACAIAAMGYWPTLQMAGQAGVSAMAAGVAVGLVATLGGMAPPVLALGGTAQERVQGMYIGIVVRFALVILLSVGVVLSGAFERKPLLLWVGLSYLLLMILDNVALVRAVRARPATPGAAGC